MRRRTGDLLRAALAALLLLAARAAAAERLELAAAVDRAQLAEDEVLVLTVRVDSDEGSPSIDLREQELPFRVLSRSWSTDVSLGVGGGSGLELRRTRVLTLALSPRRTGDLVIPPITATVKGLRRRTEPIAVKVTAAGSRPRASAQAPDRSGGSWRGWERDLALEVEVDRREVFVGEQVTATVWLFSPAGVVDTESYQPPLYDGFWVEELERPRRLTFQVRDVRGVPTRAYALQELALFPTRAGALELGAFQLEVLLRLGSDSILSPSSELRRTRRRSAPITLRVKPLPAGAPAGFQSVNVGTWKLEATPSERSVAVGQPFSVRVTASGKGNVRALALPRLPPIAGARAFEATESEELRRKGGRLGGTRTLETVLVPEAPGELVVPPLAWSSFDPRSGRYETVRGEELRIAVRPGPPAPPRERGGAEEPALRPVRTEGALAVSGPPPWIRPPFLAAVALPPLAFAGLVLADAWRRRSAMGAPARRARGAGRLARGRLRAARRDLARDGDGALSLAGVERALAGYADDRLARSTAGMTRRELAGALRAAGAPEPGVAALAAAREACDAARFGGGGDAEDVLSRAERALELLEASPRRAGRSA